MLNVTRRKMLVGSATAAIVGFDPARRAWATGPGSGVIAIPGLDGHLLTDSTTLGEAADDYGHIVHRTPAAVLVPGSVDDIVKLVKFAGKHGLRVGPTRGIGESHSTQGQAQVEAGVVIDMSALAQIHEINAHDALVDGGVRWIDLLAQTVPLGKSPPTLTDYIELSVGGTLSVGGIGGQAFHQGFQVDNVIELEVVTGRGHLVTCSREHNSELFDAVRAGLGQFGVIVRARLRLINVPSKVRVYTATYTNLATFLADQTKLIDQSHFDYVEGSATPGAAGFTFGLEAAKYFDPGAPPNDAALTAGLSFVPGTLATSDVSYFDFVNRLAPTVAFLKSIGAWGLPHPWLNLFVPGYAATSFVQAALDSTATADTGQGPILIYPFRRCEATAPFLKLPFTEHVFLLSLLRNAIPPIPDKINALLAANRALFDQDRELGGKRYPIDSVPMSQADWHAHYGLTWFAFAAAKAAFDPDHILAPGQGIF